MRKPIHLWPDHLALAERLVASGRFVDVRDVVFHAFSLLENEEAARDARLAILNAKIEAGLADVAAGRTIPAEEVFRKLRRKVGSRYAKPDAAE